MSVFFLRSWGMNPSVGQTNRMNRFTVFGEFVPGYYSFPMKKDTHSLYLQCFQQRLFLKYSEKNYKFKIPAVTDT